MKFDMGRAWDEAIRLIMANREVMAVIVGIFVFLPSLILAVAAPETITGPGEINPEDPWPMLKEYYAAVGPWVGVMALVNTIGSLALYALIADQRPTVADAIKTGLTTLLPYIAAVILLAIGVSVVIGLPLGLIVAAGGAIGGQTGAAALGLIAGLLALVGFIYLMVKFSLLIPAMVLDGLRNPVQALTASWRATKGNSVRLFAFYLLLLVAVVVIASIFQMITGLLVAVLGTGTAGLMLSGALSGVLASALGVVSVAVYSATYRQLTGPSAVKVSQTFE